MSQIKTLILGLLLLSNSLVWAQKSGGSSGSGWSQRAQARETKRWTLQEWLDQKSRNALMDQWLVMNSPSPFEFSLKLDSFSVESKVDSLAAENHNSSSGAVAAYAGFVGLYAEHENSHKENLSDAVGLLQFRLLGDSLQATSLTLGVGQRTRLFEYSSTNRSVRNLTGQAQIQMYLTRYFGLKGTYRYYSPVDDTNLGEVFGHLTEGGLFIDFKGVRVYGDYFQDTQRMKPSGVDAKIKREGIKTGLQFFF